MIGDSPAWPRFVWLLNIWSRVLRNSKQSWVVENLLTSLTSPHTVHHPVRSNHLEALHSKALIVAGSKRQGNNQVGDARLLQAGRHLASMVGDRGPQRLLVRLSKVSSPSSCLPHKDAHISQELLFLRKKCSERSKRLKTKSHDKPNEHLRGKSFLQRTEA